MTLLLGHVDDFLSDAPWYYTPVLASTCPLSVSAKEELRSTAIWMTTSIGPIATLETVPFPTICPSKAAISRKLFRHPLNRSPSKFVKIREEFKFDIFLGEL